MSWHDLSDRWLARTSPTHCHPALENREAGFEVWKNSA
jgi:hypothetical protein